MRRAMTQRPFSRPSTDAIRRSAESFDRLKADALRSRFNAIPWWKRGRLTEIRGVCWSRRAP